MLRRAAMERAGATKLVANPAVTRILEQNRAWLDALELQVGGQVTLRNEPTLPIHGAYAEKG